MGGFNEARKHFPEVGKMQRVEEDEITAGDNGGSFG